AVPGGRIGKKCLDRPVTVDFARRELVALGTTHQAEIFGQDDEACACARRARDQLASVAQIRDHLGLRDHLHGGDDDRRCSGDGWAHCGCACCGVTSLPGLLATRSRRLTTGSRQDPVTSYSKEKALDSGSRKSNCAMKVPSPIAGFAKRAYTTDAEVALIS